MELFRFFLFFFLGVAGLYYGAEALVRGSVRISQMLGISPMIMGLTVVAFGTSAPEFAVSLVAAIQHSRSIAIGNIIGSNIANIGLIVGLTAFLHPLVVNRRLLFKEAPFLVLTAFLAYGLFANNLLSRAEGGILLILMIFFLTYMIRIARREHAAFQAEEASQKMVQAYEGQFHKIALIGHIYRKYGRRGSFVLHIAVVIVGILFLTLGSNWLIVAAKIFGRMLGISEIVIGLTIVAVGTSLPELATSLVSAFKKEADISLGNIIGSNIFNTLFVLGAIGLLNPVTIDASVGQILVPIMIGFTLIFVLFMYTGRRIVRWEAGVLFLSYVVFINYVYF
jgi:cation:H+ antiporter